MLKMIWPLLFLSLQTILAAPEFCSLKAESGRCRGYFPRWYFNKDTHICESFIYGGCGGNANSFKTKKECLDTCSGICQQPMVRGYCRARFTRYHFDTTSGSCEQFAYGGCGGNDNNFRSVEECRKVCYNECKLQKERGPCRAAIPRYYYNMETGNCEKFIYGGCMGNANNFENKKPCEARCVISITRK